jgi:putative ABC transport system permease protein
MSGSAIVRAAAGSTRVAVSVAVAVGLGVGATLAILSVLHNVFVPEQPFVDVDQLVVLENHGAYDLGVRKVEKSELSWPDYQDLEAYQHTLALVGGIGGAERTVWDAGDRVRSVNRAFVTADLMRLLGVRALAGRALTDADFAPGAATVAVVTEGLWRKQLGGDGSAVGRAVRLDGLAVTIVGVIEDDVVALLREQKDVIEEPDQNESLLMPLVPGGGGRLERLLALRRENRALPMLTVIGRLRPGVSLDSAQSDVRTISDRLAREFPETNEGRSVQPSHLTEWQTRAIRQMRPMLIASAALALLVACASATGLMMADAVRRQPEMAVRHALGASKGHLIRLVLKRATAWAVPGGLLGIGIAWAILAWVDVADRGSSPVLHLPFGPGLLAGAVVLAALSGVALGGVGVWVLRQQDVTLGLKEAGQTVSFGRRRWLMLAALVTTQVGTATSLGFVSVLLIRSMSNLYGIDLGFQTGHAFVVRLLLPQEHYNTIEEQSAYFEQALARVRTTKGVKSAGISDAPPLSQMVVTMGGDMALEIPGRHVEALAPLNAQRVSPGYFESAGMRMRRGRGFAEEDGRANAPVVVVDEAFCRTYLGAADPLQTFIRMGDRRFSIVGVAADVRSDGPAHSARPTLYVLRKAIRSAALLGYIVVNPEGSVAETMQDVVAELGRIDRRVVVDDPHTLASLFARNILARQRMLRLLTAAASIVLLLTVFSVGGALSEFVENKLREIALRKALGASSSRTAWLVCRHVGGPCVAGLAFGSVGGWVLAQTLSGQLFGVGPSDPSTVLATVLLQLGLGLIAAAGPVRRALWIHPARALRAL